MKNLQVLCVIHFFIIVHNLQYGEPNVCWNPNTNTYYCCGGYENKNETCIACKHGFTSYGGKRCMPCGDHFYGKTCLSICKCLPFERCDHVFGCLPIVNTVSYETKTIQITKFKDDYEPESNNTNDKTKRGGYMIMVACLHGIMLDLLSS